MPFPTAFYFGDGQACVNFNQLALACDNRWEEARGLLGEGVWATFFRGIGRLDLSTAAKQAAEDPDRDRGLSLLLEKLPADPDCLRPPKLAVESTVENLGQISVGTDLTFEVVIKNQGMLLLRGAISSNADWLVFGDRASPSQKVFQTRHSCTIPVRVDGKKLRAGVKPLVGELIIDTNGGTITVPVRAGVPIRPFPRGVYANDSLAGAASPREVAVKAKDFPNEAAILFAAGAVKAWYASNGWVYPVEGTAGSGKGAVQQFFEALGLAKAPRLELSVNMLAFKGRGGEVHTRRLTLRTQEAKPVFAQAWSNRDWIKFGTIKYLGNKVEIPIEVIIPARPGETLQAQVTIRGNGMQQFVVPITVTVERGKPVGRKAPQTGESLDAVEIIDENGNDSESSSSMLPLILWFVGGFLVAGLLLVLLVGGIIAAKFFL
jgi:hypothetical protein